MEKKYKRYLKADLISLFFIAVSFISVTLAWFAYTGIASSGLNVDIKAWHIEFNGESKASNVITIPLSNIYPGMETVVESVNIKNKGDSEAKISYKIESVRILDKELDTTIKQEDLIDKLSNEYPFSIDISLSKEYVDANIGESSIDLSVSWPLDSDQNDKDSEWGNKTYEFQANEEKLKAQDKNYNMRTSIKVVISLIAEQNTDKFTLNTGNMVLYDPVLEQKCDKLENTCYKMNLITPYYDDSENVYLLPNILDDYGTEPKSYEEFNDIITAINTDWVSVNEPLGLKKIIDLVSTDIYNTKLIRENLSDTIVGNISKEERFKEYMETKVLPGKYNSYITFNSEMYNYLDTTKCYWLNYEYNEEKAFALSKLSEGIMKIYPENKTEKCSAIPIINVPKEKLFNEIH